MYFVVSAGGTAGHINPALAVADELRSCGHEVLFAGTPDHIEARLARQANFEFVGFAVSGFDKAHPLTLLTSTKRLMSATREAKRLFAQRRPDAVLGFGAYVSIPVGRAAASMGIPLIIHEQNSVPGMANVYLSRKADKVAIAYAAAAEGLSSSCKPVVVGNPVRVAVERSDARVGRELFGVPADATMLLVFGGSLGAAHLNSAVAAMKDDLLAVEGLHVVHATGDKGYDDACSKLALSKSEQERWHLVPYIDRMGDVLAGADLVVSRAGASSLAEIATLAVPAVLVPYPFARGDHQTRNAQELVEVGAACLVADDDVDTPAFSELVMGLLRDPDRRASMRSALGSFSGADARRRMAQLAVQAAEGQ